MEFIDAIEPGRLRREIERLEYEKTRVVQWTQYDEERLRAYREVEWLRKKIKAAKNRIEDDCSTINHLCEVNGFNTGTGTKQ